MPEAPPAGRVRTAHPLLIAYSAPLGSRLRACVDSCIPFSKRSGTTDRQRGPGMVHASLSAGLSQLGMSFVAGGAIGAGADRVGLLSGLSLLRQAVAAKRKGRIRCLLAGPNVLVTPLEAGGILLSPEIDRVVTPSRWVSDIYVQLAPALAGKVVEWPAGVDTEYWQPDAGTPRHLRRGWLVYDKCGSAYAGLLRSVIAMLDLRGQQYHVVRYGQYRRPDYRSLLRTVRGAIVLSPSESQGIAQFEAWACDTPTLVWDRHRWEYGGMVFDGPNISSSPYLSPACGIRFSDAADSADRFDEFAESLDRFSPRDYVLGRFTLPAAAAAYCCLFDEACLLT